jgi:hypothetical protein
MTFASGIKGVWFGVNFAGAWGERTAFRNVKALRSELYFGTADAELNETRFHALESYKGQLEELLGFELSFEELPRRKACRVAMYRPGSITEEAQWSDYGNFFIESQHKLRNALESLGGLTELLALAD